MKNRFKRFLSLALVFVLMLSYVPAAALAEEANAAPALPTATVKEIQNKDLTFAMNFVADQVTDEQLAYYGDWYADFELTVNKDVTFNANGGADGYLSGQYDAWSENWVNVPFEAVTLNADESLKIMEYASELMGEPGLKYTYKEVYEVVKDFDCGVCFTTEFLEANPDLVVTLELRMYNPENEDISYVIGQTYVFRNDFVAQNTTTKKLYDNVCEAAMEAAEGETVILLKDAEDILVPVIDQTKFDLNGHVLTASYVTCYGDIIDSSEDNTGLLKVDGTRFLIQKSNEQLPVKDGEGYRFVEVLKFNQKVKDGPKFIFQPLFEEDAHALLLQGADVTGVTINVRVSWKQAQGVRSQDFVYDDEKVIGFLESYEAVTEGKYGQQFWLTLTGAESVEDLTFTAIVASDTGVKFTSADEEKDDENAGTGESGNVTVKDNMVAEEVTIGNAQASAVVPEGALLEENTTNLTLTVTEVEQSQSNITLGENEEQKSVDVHIAGISAENTVPMMITLAAFAEPGLNEGNLKLYHVENGETVEMTRVDAAADFNAHNQFCYDPATGDVVLYMATFSEVTSVSDTENAWNGEFDYSWYDADKTELTIANADQLAAFGAIVGGMDGQTQDSFQGKTVKLICNINIGDLDSENDLVFYPIGYNSSDGKYEKTGVAVSTGFYAFQGIFDGNGHTISNFYQNTWEMKGDHNWYDAALQYYRDGMGLFGKVYGGTVKNLTVENFSSDGEIATTGVIAAYADCGATFENIAIFNCNPRVYNIGNGGIVGCVGWYANDVHTEPVTFRNITVDNSNKISALWGSYDVACGGLVGQYYPISGQSNAIDNAGIYMENCHVSAQIDVYNDVCGNYQYYAYRYAGMLIGSVRENVTIDGHVYPDMDGIEAKDCTVHFGTWNDYYYCELVDNSTASYTHDHQMSRLEEIQAINGTTITYLDGTTGTVPASGRANYVIVDYTKGHGTENATCYHFLNGEVWTHDMAGIQDGVDENGDGQDDLKEDKQHIYLEFNNLVTGYGWGVTSKGINDMEGVQILDREVGDSVTKFVSVAQESYTTGTTVTIGELFKAAEIDDEKLSIKGDNVQVTVSPVGEDSTAGGTYTANTTDWTQGTLTFSGTGAATITIQDYYFCTPTTITVEVKGKEAVEKFETKFTGNFLYRVGNQNAVKLDSLFKEKDGAEIGTVSVDITSVVGASGTYTPNATWTNGTIQFSGTGVVKVTIQDDDTYCKPTVLILEVVDAVNATTATSATSNNVVLLNDIGSGFTVSGGYTFYGNGFTLNYTGNGQYLNNGLRQGVVNVSENGTLDNLRIVASIYPTAYLYYGYTTYGDYVQGGPSDGNNRYYYQLSAVAASGNATISNCYIYGGRNNIFVDDGDVTITDTVMECGVVANVQIESNSSYTVTFNNVTTIQYRVNPTIGSEEDKAKVMLGAGILVGLGETGETNPNIVLKGDLKQYNWVNTEDANAVSNNIARAIIQGAVDATDYNHTIDGKPSSNLGIIFMNTAAVTITEKTPYALADITLVLKDLGNNKISGQVYSLKNATNDQISSDIENADKSTDQGEYLPTITFALGNQAVTGEDRYLKGDASGVEALYTKGETPLTLDLAKLVTATRYTGVPCSVTTKCVTPDGTEKTGVVTLDTEGIYTLVFTATDNVFYNQNGESVDRTPVTKTLEVKLSVDIAEPNIPDAVITVNKTALDGGYNESYGDRSYKFNPLNAITITDAEGTVNLTTNIASTDIVYASSSSAFAGATTITVTYNDGRVLKIVLGKPSLNSPGSSKAITYANDGTIKSAAKVASKSATGGTWTVTSYSFKGTNGKEVTNNTVVTFTFPDKSCVTGDTLVMLADGTQKRIDEVTYCDELLVWDFFNGQYAVVPSSIIFYHGDDYFEVLSLNFEDGTTVKTINVHGFFDADTNAFEFIDAENVESYIGHSFVKVDGDSYKTVKLVGYDIKEEYTGCYSIQTAMHNNFITEGMFSLTIPEYEGWFDYFEIGEGMKYDEEKMQADIEKYGLYTYEEFAEYVTCEQFIAFNGPYLKVLVGRGVVTYEQILELIATYVNP